jgi:hypothetical protein
MLDVLRWTFIAACLYFALLTFGAPFEPLGTQSGAADSQSQSTLPVTLQLNVLSPRQRDGWQAPCPLLE